MKHLLLAFVLVLPVIVVGVGSDPSAQAKQKKFTKTSAVAQADQDHPPSEDFLITDPAGPFSFQKVNKIRRITQLTITLTLDDGDTGPGDTDENDLTLALDGIDTGLKLNGFPDDQTATQTISGVPMNEPAIRAALKADGQLAATIIDADPGDQTITGSSADITTLVIKGKQKKR